MHVDGGFCHIYLNGRISRSSNGYKSRLYRNDVYRVKISHPLGFALNKVLKICQCDVTLKTIANSPDSCNIDTQTVPRPANSWITGRTDVDNSHKI